MKDTITREVIGPRTCKLYGVGTVGGGGRAEGIQVRRGSRGAEEGREATYADSTI